jgi:hypothetical protein
MKSAWGVSKVATGGTVKASPAPSTTAFTVVDDGTPVCNLAAGDPILVDVSATATPSWEQVWVDTATDGTNEVAITVTPPLSAAPTATHDVIGSIAYKLTSDSTVRKTFSAYAYLDGDVKFSFAGCLANFKMADFGVGTIPKAVFSVEAISWTVEDAACGYTPSVDYALKPAVVLGASLQLKTDSTFAEEYVRNFEFDLGMAIARREAIQAASGAYAIEATGRKVTGSINPYMDGVTHYEPWLALESAELHVKLADKLTQPNIIAIRLSEITRTDVGLEDADGVWANSIPFDCGGDDDAEAYFGILKTPVPA